MPYLQKNINDMYRRALAALDAEFDDLPADSLGAEAADELRAAFAIIEQKSGAKMNLDGAAQAGTAQRGAARRNLQEFLRILADTANTIARRKAGFNQQFPSPAGKNDRELLNDARAAAPVAVAGKADFIRYGLKEPFIQSGADLITAFETSFAATDEALASRGAAVGSKKEAVEDADDAFDDLDRYIRNHYSDQPEKIAAWKIATHIERSPSKKSEDKPKP